MKNCLLILVCLVCIRASASPLNDSIPAKPAINGQSYQPALRLTAKDIEHLPFTSIMEVVNAAFPFLFSDPPLTTDYNFIVDGRTLAAPNAINPSQVELIEFYPVAFNLANGSRSARGGTIVITTKKNSNGFNVRSLTGAVLGTDRFPDTRLVPNAGVDHTPKLATTQEIGYAYNRSKLQFNTALGYTRNVLPAYNIKAGNFNEEYDNTYNRVRFSNFASYQLSPKWRVDASFLLANQQYDIETFRNAVPTPNSTQDVEVGDKTIFWHGAAGITYQVSPRIDNRIQFEYSRMRNEGDMNGVFQFGTSQTIFSTGEALNKYRNLAVTDEFRGSINAGPRIELGWELLLRYAEQKINGDMVSTQRQEPGGLPNFSTVWYTASDRSLAIMPRLSFGLAKQFYATVGFTHDAWKNTSYVFAPSLRKVLPYGGLRWIMPGTVGPLASLKIHSTYGASWQVRQPFDYLDQYSGSEPTANPSMIGPDPLSKEGQLPGYNWVSGIDAGLIDNKLSVSFNYVTGRIHPRLTMPFWPGTYIFFYSEVKRRGLSAAIQAVIADKEEFSLSLRSLVFYEVYELKSKNDEAVIQNANPILNNHQPKQVRGSLQLRMAASKFFMQANALLRFNDKVLGVTEPVDAHALNFLVLGYNINKRISISLQARNLVPMKETASPLHYGTRYVGAGLVISQ